MIEGRGTYFVGSAIMIPLSEHMAMCLPIAVMLWVSLGIEMAWTGEY